jgi:hypothetical protein
MIHVPLFPCLSNRIICTATVEAEESINKKRGAGSKKTKPDFTADVNLVYPV